MLCIPFVFLTGRNIMSKWIAKLFQTKPNANDIVRFIRTEYRSDTEHLRDEDVLHYYDHIMNAQRRT